MSEDRTRPIDLSSSRLFPKLSSDGGGDDLCGASIRMAIPFEAPVGIEVNQHGRNVCQDSLPNRPLHLIFGPELRHDHERRSPALPCKVSDREEDLASDVDASCNRDVAAIRDQKARERHQSRFVARGLPDESRTEM